MSEPASPVPPVGTPPAAGAPVVQAGAPVPPAPPAEGAPPPAAQTVLASDAVEGDAGEVVRLRRERDDAVKRTKDVETRAATLEDENRRLKAIPTPPPPQKKKSWLDGATFFDDPAD